MATMSIVENEKMVDEPKEMNNMHIMDSKEKLDSLNELAKRNSRTNTETAFAENPALTYLVLRSHLKLPYEVKLNYLISFERSDLVLPTEISKHKNGGEIKQDGDILYGFAVQSKEPIRRVLVTLGKRVLWVKEYMHFKDNFNVSLEESLDGLTIPLISFMFFRFNLTVYGNNGILKDVEINLYYSLMDVHERRVIATLPHVYSKDNTCGLAFTDSFFEIFYQKMKYVNRENNDAFC